MEYSQNTAKIAAVSSIDKGTGKKDIVFCNRTELTITYQLVPQSDKVFPLLSTHCQNHNNRHVLIRFAEKWKEHLDSNYVVGGGVLIDL